MGGNLGTFDSIPELLSQPIINIVRLELSTRTDIALRALRHLAGFSGRRSTLEVAEAIDTSPQFLPHVMAPLVRAGWIRSTRGPGGGYRLVADLETVSLRQLVEAIEGPIDDGRCVLQEAPCPRDDHCALHIPWQRARAALLTELDRTPLHSGSEVTP